MNDRIEIFITFPAAHRRIWFWNIHFNMDKAVLETLYVTAQENLFGNPFLYSVNLPPFQKWSCSKKILSYMIISILLKILVLDQNSSFQKMQIRTSQLRWTALQWCGECFAFNKASVRSLHLAGVLLLAVTTIIFFLIYNISKETPFADEYSLLPSLEKVAKCAVWSKRSQTWLNHRRSACLNKPGIQ